MEPIYRDINIVSISLETNTQRDDRIVFKISYYEIIAKPLPSSSIIKIKLTSFNPG